MCFPFFPPLRFKSLRYFALASLEPKTLENIAVYVKQNEYMLLKWGLVFVSSFPTVIFYVKSKSKY